MQDPGSWIQSLQSEIPYPGSWIQYPGPDQVFVSSILGPESWIQGWESGAGWLGVSGRSGGEVGVGVTSVVWSVEVLGGAGCVAVR